MRRSSVVEEKFRWGAYHVFRNTLTIVLIEHWRVSEQIEHSSSDLNMQVNYVEFIFISGLWIVAMVFEFPTS